MIHKKHLIYSLVALLTVFAILLWMGNKLTSSYHSYHQAVAIESSRSMANQVSQFIVERERLVSLFAKTHSDSLHKVILDPENDQLRDSLAQDIANFFPNYFAFTIADMEGDPYFENFDGFISTMCIADLTSYSRDKHYNQIIHPNPEAYHFDVMSKFSIANLDAILLISFHANLLAEIVNTTQTKGHQMMLIYPGQNDLIEVLSSGSRIGIVRDDYRLRKDERARILQRVNVMNTRWQAVDFHEINLFSDYRQQLYIECLVIMIIISMVLSVLYYRLQQEALRRIEAENEKEHFMRVVAHELRAPVANMSGALSLINEGLVGDIPPEAKDLLQVCSRNTQQLTSLVDDFLDFHRMESGSFKLVKNSVYINDLIKITISNCQVFAEKFDSKIVFLPCEEEITSTIDSKRIQQALTNLLSNAAKYGANNATIEVDLSRQGDKVIIGVRDYGSGVPESVQHTLFRPYVVAPVADEMKVTSTGLGLSIAKSIVEAHGGEIGFTSEENIGCRFYFSFPATDTKK